MKGKWRKQHNVELHDIYYSPNIIRVIISERTRWVENVAGIQEKRNTQGAFVGKHGGRKETTCKTYAWVVGEYYNAS